MNLKLQSDAWDVWLELAKLQLITGGFSEAMEIWGKLHQCVPNDPAVYILHGDLMVISKRFHEAELDYRQALAINSRFEPALVRLASCYLAQDKSDQAEKTFHILTSMDPKSPDIVFQMGNYWRLKGNIYKAEACFFEAINLEPEDLGLQRMLAEFYFDTNCYDKAEEILAKIIRQIPENRSVRKFMVEVFLKQNRMHEAQAMIAGFSKEKADDLELDLLKGKYHLFALQPSIAASNFSSIIDKSSNFPIIHYLLGIAYLMGGRNQLAVKSFVKSLSLDPEFAEEELVLADLYYKRGKYKFGLKHAQRVADKEPENFRAYMILGNLFLAQNRYDAAMVKFKEAGIIHPEAVSPIYYMGIIAEQTHQVEKALNIYANLLNNKPYLVDVARYMQLLIKEGRIKTAEQFFENAIEQNPKNAYLYFVLGEVASTAGDMRKARICFEKSIVIDSSLVSSYMNLAEIYGLNKDLNNKIMVLERCIENI